MQRKGVEAGRQAGEFVARLHGECPALRDARIHLIGHSFGGLVVVNAARYLTARKAGGELPGLRLHTLCLLQAAIASNWFEDEPAILEAFGGAIGCIYSGYDTANGFYYPLANNSRRASGFVGLCNMGGDAAAGKGLTPVTLGKGGLFASLAEPPRLADALAKAGKPGGAETAWLLNLDASRLIYQGPVAAGGGHVDIFKDDVIHLTWAVTRLGLPAETSAAHAGGMTLPPGLSLQQPPAPPAAPSPAPGRP
jgi:pimeloyl-ACP methyl ester carboxylesterase